MLTMRRSCAPSRRRTAPARYTAPKIFTPGRSDSRTARRRRFPRLGESDRTRRLRENRSVPFLGPQRLPRKQPHLLPLPHRAEPAIDDLRDAPEILVMVLVLEIIGELVEPARLPEPRRRQRGMRGLRHRIGIHEEIDAERIARGRVVRSSGDVYQSATAKQ